jgi:copper chaperone
VAAIITASTNFGGQQKMPAVTETETSIQAPASDDDHTGAGSKKSNIAKAVLDVQGMSCSGCIYTIKTGLAGINGINDVLVDLNSGRVEVFYDNTQVKDLQEVASAITAVGYPATLKRTMTAAEIARENDRYASRSKLYIAAVGDWEISRGDFEAELSHARNRYEKVYGSSIFSGDQGMILLQRLQSQIATGLISQGIQMQEIRKAGYRLPAETVASEFNDYLSKKGITRQELKRNLADNGYGYDYFYKKFENRLTIDRYLEDRVLSGLSTEMEKRQRYADWYNNARLLAKVVYYDKNLEKTVKNSSAAGGCGNGCSTKQSQS